MINSSMIIEFFRKKEYEIVSSSDTEIIFKGKINKENYKLDLTNNIIILTKVGDEKILFKFLPIPFIAFIPILMNILNKLEI